jgi:hypothetical protein
MTISLRDLGGIYDMIEDYIDKNLEQILINRENEARKLLREFESDRKAKEEEGE